MNKLGNNGDDLCVSVSILIHTQISVVRKDGESSNIIFNTMQCTYSEYMNIYLLIYLLLVVSIL